MKTSSVPAALPRARTLIAPALRDTVGRLAPSLVPMVDYHLGFIDTAGRPAGSHGGKAVRPALAMLAAEAAGARAETAIPGAVAAELVHNFSLLHDDVMDGDRERRHRPTVWALFGVGHAICAGDALLALAQEVLLDPRVPGGRDAARRLLRATQEMIAGQVQDLALEGSLDTGESAYLEMAAGKTGALLGGAAAIGAVLAGAPQPVVDALDSFGRHLGMAFQAVDDILGLWGSPSMTGKPVGSDIRARKASLPIVAALAAGGPSASELHSLLSNGEIDEGAVARATAIVAAAGGRARAEREAEQQLSAAVSALTTVALAPGATAELIDVATFVVRRDY